MTPLTHTPSGLGNTTSSAAYPAVLPQRISLVMHNRSVLISTDDVVWLEGSGNYTFIHTRDKRRYLMAKTLKTFEQELMGSSFARIHKSHVVNLAHVRSISMGYNAYMELTGGQLLTIARRRLTPALNQYMHHRQRMTSVN